MTTRPPRVMRLDLSTLVEQVQAQVRPKPEEMHVASRAEALLSVLTDAYGSSGIGVRYYAQIPDEVWDAAHSIVEGGMDSPALRAVAEQIDPDAFPSLMSRLTNIDPKPDPSIESEFI